MASQSNGNAYLSRLRPRSESQPSTSILGQTNKKRSRNALQDVSNKNTRNDNEKTYNLSRDDPNSIAIDESKGDANVFARPSSRRRTKVDLAVRQESFGVSRSRRGIMNVQNDDRKSSEPIGITSTKAGPKKSEILYEIVHPDYRLERISYDGQTHTLGIAAHDKRNKSDVQFAAPYVSDIYQTLFSNEGKYHPSTYLQEQTEINSKMRAILVDWLVEVHAKFRLAPETLYLCINILDRYCKCIHVKRARLQLVGVTALLLACKYEEIHPPEVRDFVFITDRAYTRQEVVNMEQEILHELKFHLTVPTAYPFLLRYLHLVNASSLTKSCANYFMERTLQEHNFLDYRPSLIAAAAVVLAINNEEVIKYECPCNRDLPGIPLILLEYTGFNEQEIIECAEKISLRVNEETVTASKRLLIAVKKKYREVQHGCIGHIITQAPNIPLAARIDKKRRETK